MTISDIFNSQLQVSRMSQGERESMYIYAYALLQILKYVNPNQVHRDSRLRIL